ncbi:hypothetical protein PQR71_18140, partial [Paraburkholderia fungorum]
KERAGPTSFTTVSSGAEPTSALVRHGLQDALRLIEAFVAKTHSELSARNTPQTIAYASCTSFSEADRLLQEWLEFLQRVDWNTPMTLALTSATVGSVITLSCFCTGSSAVVGAIDSFIFADRLCGITLIFDKCSW